MSRPSAIAAATIGWAVALAAALAWLVPAAVWKTTSPTLPMRPWVERMLRPSAPDRPLVLWLGDSTTTDHPGAPAYPRLIETEVSKSLPIEVLNASRPGLDAFQHYLVLCRLLTYSPAAVFVLANPRLMHGEGGSEGILEIASMIPLSELPRSLLLPWYDRGITLPRLLLARTMDWDAVRDGFAAYEGGRRHIEKALHPDGARLPRPRAETMAEALASYDKPIDASSAAVRMLAASARMAASRGVAAVVILTPMPVHYLRRHGLYGPRFAARVDALREAVAAAGGTVIDLHRELPRSEFRDLLGHYTAAGNAHLARRLEPLVLSSVREAAIRTESR